MLCYAMERRHHHDRNSPRTARRAAGVADGAADGKELSFTTIRMSAGKSDCGSQTNLRAMCHRSFHHDGVHINVWSLVRVLLWMLWCCSGQSSSIFAHPPRLGRERVGPERRWIFSRRCRCRPPRTGESLPMLPYPERNDLDCERNTPYARIKHFRCL
jgi:hypothetical protein